MSENTTGPVHIHSEQFDGWMHAECGAGDWEAPSDKCAYPDDFEKMPRANRCKKCTRYWWPRGFGDPGK